MLVVKTLNDAEKIIEEHFGEIRVETEWIAMEDSLDRILAEDLKSNEAIPAFNRSCMDGYAVVASDTFGASDSIPVILTVKGKVDMGTSPDFSVEEGTCAYVPTGGFIPEGADGIVMIEYIEDYGDGTIGVIKATSPGKHFVYRGDDVKEGEVVLKKGTRIGSKEIGILADLGIAKVPVKRKPVVGIMSTGDELVPCCAEIKPGQIRDVNAPMMMASVKKCGCEVKFMGIMSDNYADLYEGIKESIHKCDMLLISGGTSVGEKDLTSRIIGELGVVFIHGLAVKPGKPTIVGSIDGKPVFGMPGHPVAAFFIFHLLARKLLYSFLEFQVQPTLWEGRLSCAVSSNHGREEYIAVTREEDIVVPMISKSGLIATLKNAEGFIVVGRDCEGYAQGERVIVELF